MSRLRTLALTAALSMSASVIAAPMASATPESVTVANETASRNDQAAANEAAVTFYLDQIFNKHNSSVIDTYIAEDLVQHSPSIGDGREALRAVIDRTLTQNPQIKTDIYRVVGQGDLVLAQRKVPGATDFAVTDTFRVRDGKFVEHWDTVQGVPATTVSGNDMFSTLSGPSTPESVRLTNLNRRIVTDYYTRLDKNHDLGAVDRFVSPSVIQHDPLLANGSAAVKDAAGAKFAAFPASTASEEKITADGDLVTVRYHAQTSATDLGQAISEIFRVKNGKIVEHWTATQNVPATSANNNTMF